MSGATQLSLEEVLQMQIARQRLEANAGREERQEQLLLYRWSLQASFRATLEAYLAATGQAAPAPVMGPGPIAVAGPAPGFVSVSV